MAKEYNINGQSMTRTNAQLGMLEADFSGLLNLESVVDNTLRRLAGTAKSSGAFGRMQSGEISVEQFDNYFAELVRVELGKTLGIIRNKAVEKARKVLPNDPGNAASAVLRTMYKSGREGNVKILSSRRRLSSKQRVVEPANGGKSGIKRNRTIKARTKQINSYYGPDRGFILRILESGRDEFMAHADGAIGRGSKATHGRRGAMASRSFFHMVGQDMEEAARQLGQTLVNNVEQFINKKIQ